MLFLLISFLFFQNSIFAAGEACTTSTHVAAMPPPRSQGNTDFCYGFAATALLQNYYCSTKAPPCEFTDKKNDQLSVIDALAIANYGEGGLVGGGFTKNALEQVRRKGGLAKETCAPFDSFLRSTQFSDSKERFSFAQAVKKTNEKFLDVKCPIEERKKLAAQLKTQSQLVTNIDQIMDALSKRELSIVLKEVVLPRQCEDQRVPLKNFKVEGVQGKTFESVRGAIQKQLKKGTPLVTHICSYSPSEMRASRDGCGLHALVVSGIREQCCAGKCSYEYQFYDSDKAFTGKELDKDGWVSEAVYSERLQRKWSRTTENENLYWLEPSN